MLASDFALQMAPMIGVNTLEAQASSLNGINLSDGDKAAMAIAITQALQEVFGLGPTTISEQQYGTTLRAPTNVTFNATQFSTTISAFATWASWMEGCTIQGSDGEDNELLSATELLRPYTASTGAVSATVYADAIKLPSWVKNTMGPVWTPPVPELQPASNREEFRFWQSPHQWGHWKRHGWPVLTSRQKHSGIPCVYLVESRYDPTTGALPLFMRFNPMPGQAYPITFRVKRKPPVIVADDITDTLPRSLTVTGTLTPDVTGVFSRVTGQQLYVRYSDGVAVSAQIDVNSPTWEILGRSGASNRRWLGDQTALLGTYSPESPAAGNATISVTSGSAFDGSSGVAVIPTDWHESILLPFAKKWFLGHPAINNPSLAAQIMQQYQTARAELESFIPQISRVRGDYH